MTFKTPMLAASEALTVDRVLDIMRSFPPDEWWNISVKLDGIRCVTARDPETNRVVAYGRSGKPIPNRRLQADITALGIEGLDGELLAQGVWSQRDGCPTPLAAATHAARKDGPGMLFAVFDCVPPPEDAYENYDERSNWLSREFSKVSPEYYGTVIIHNPSYRVRLKDELDATLHKAEQQVINEGFEGLIVRRVDTPYKHGRTTLREASMLKVKRRDTIECTVLDTFEQMHNDNPKPTHAGGVKGRRGTAKVGLVPADTLGGLTVSHPKYGEFSVGSGFTDEERRALWGQDLRGRFVRIEFLPSGTDKKPRHPVFKGFREAFDMDHPEQTT